MSLLDEMDSLALMIIEYMDHLSHYFFKSSYFRLRDAESWEQFSVESLGPYLKLNSSKFLSVFERLSDLGSEFEEIDEKEIRFMLDALIYARQSMQHAHNVEE
jgi:hypothetical protein